MANVINTNISSLNAQRNLSTSQSSLATSLQRLSTGLRINSAKDDAAGQAISTRMTAQINGMQQASRNANDGISMSQTAEGAMGSINDILLRMRDLSVQSSNGTNGTAERATIQNEVDQLYQEIDRISGSTDFNGLKLLDGSAKNNSFQVGANAGQTISFGINEVSTKAMSLNSGSALGDLNSGRVSVPAADADAAENGDLVINGKKIEFPAPTAATGTEGDPGYVPATHGANSPKEYAAAINASSGLTGVTATSYNAVSGLSGASGVTSGLQITVDNADGTAGAPITIDGSSSMSDLVDKINKQVGGITASIGKDGGLSLTNDTGAKITIGGNIEGSGLKVGANEGYLALSSADGKPITVSSDNGAAALNKFGLNASTGAGTVVASSTVSASAATSAAASAQLNDALNATPTSGQGKGKLTESDTVKINGVAIGTSGASAGEKAAAINAVKGQTGVTASATTTAFLDLDFTDDTIALNVNGVDIDTAAAKDTAGMVEAINKAGISGLTATTDAATGKLKLTSESGSDIVLGAAADSAFVKGVSSSATETGIALPGGATDPAYMAIRGELKLSGENGAAVRVEGEAESLAKLGLVAQGGSDATIGGKLDVTTQANAQSAIARIDKAISYVAEQRATMGAVQNRLNTTISNLATATENTTSARSRIQDTDFATETANMTRGQILQQAGTAMLAQANSLPNGVLSLLRG